eukprot:CAMPEP_0183291548 /NCGR_PEP_ID=MMETSP0160_2-20130417/928_1 /TAXON_ID=2839 ORGANISM="Odontella Sinensis, Strain Grunow 1884" /NCGR_SAMPLE_ID=MMETSP0160_2 /ASSEMBLY_ACC=CAM_ASM_000250 /LENGTH=153 /DNA_ID=CAMNT_0025452369 /DNA_START=163 /DNA_END=624 /DNA_ORIENTATION=+
MNVKAFALLSFSVTSSVSAWSTSKSNPCSRSTVEYAPASLPHNSASEQCDRRNVLGAVFGGAAFVASSVVLGPENVQALDIDAFMNAELEKDLKNCDPKKDPKCIPKLSQDEALCKYGQSGNARGEACKRVKEGGGTLDKKPQGKSLGGAYAM